MSSIVLDPRSIVESLAYLQIDVNGDDITHPTADRVQAIYYAFCNQILEIPEKSLCELPYECIVNSETSDMQQRSNSLIILLTTMKCFIMDFADPSYDFIMCDLISPSPKRTRRFLSVMADFIYFYKKASQVFEKTSREFENARKTINDGQEEVRLAEERKNTLRSEYDLKKRKELELLSEKNLKSTKLADLLKEVSNIGIQRDRIVESIGNKEEEICHIKKEATSLQSQIVHLSKGLVESPAQLFKDVEEQRERIRTLQNTCDTERQRIHDNAESIIVIEQISKLLDERFNDTERLRNLQDESSRREQVLAEFKTSLDEWMKKKTHTEDVLGSVIASSNDEAKAHERLCEVYSSRLYDLERKKENLDSIVKNLRENAPYRNEISQLKNELVSLRNEKVRGFEHARTQCQELLNRYRDLLRKYHQAEADFESYSKMFSDSLHSISNALDDAECASNLRSINAEINFSNMLQTCDSNRS